MACFIVTYNMKERGLSTLFKHKIFTIDAKERVDWDYSNLQQYLGNYEFCVSNNVFEKFKENKEVEKILKEMLEDKCHFKVDNNKSPRYSGNKQYIKCIIPVYILEFFKKLFISTLVFDAENTVIPESESITFRFDTGNKTVTIADLELYMPSGNPYYIYARNAASSLSVEAIGLENYCIENTKDIKDFYNLNQISKWKDANQLKDEKGIEGKAGIYMLYDKKANTFYIGKAIKLKDRILCHKNNSTGNDPIPNFTHYRYSVISGEYYEFLYLIENAAIHDAAWILNMPKATKFTPSLAEECLKNEISINNCKMVNTQEHQTRKQ